MILHIIFKSPSFPGKIQNGRERFNLKRGYNNRGFRESPRGIQGNLKGLLGKPFAHDSIVLSRIPLTSTLFPSKDSLGIKKIDLISGMNSNLKAEYLCLFNMNELLRLLNWLIEIHLATMTIKLFFKLGNHVIKEARGT